MKVVIPIYESPANQFLSLRSELLYSPSGPAFNLWEALACLRDEEFPLEFPNGEVIRLDEALFAAGEMLYLQNANTNRIFMEMKFKDQYRVLKRMRDADLIPHNA